MVKRHLERERAKWTWQRRPTVPSMAADIPIHHSTGGVVLNSHLAIAPRLTRAVSIPSAHARPRGLRALKSPDLIGPRTAHHDNWIRGQRNPQVCVCWNSEVCVSLRSAPLRSNRPSRRKYMRPMVRRLAARKAPRAARRP